MKSNVCKIENGSKDLEAILRESEKVAVYNELTHKQTLQLRLICEEIDGMLPNVIDDFDGDLWIEFEQGVCKVNISLRFKEFTAEKKKELVKIASNKKNAAAVGIVGKIRSAIEHYFLDEEVQQAYAMSTSAMHRASVASPPPSPSTLSPTSVRRKTWHTPTPVGYRSQMHRALVCLQPMPPKRRPSASTARISRPCS